MSSTLFNAGMSRDDLFEGSTRLLNVVPIEYRVNHLKHLANARQLQLFEGDQVIVEGRYGPVIATVTGKLQRKVIDAEELPAVLRKANQADLKKARNNEELEDDAHRFALQCIETRQLPMKLIRTQCMQDGSRVVFYFSADGRVDFRALVRDLAKRFRTRIEMYQIGVRDGAQMLGGIGPCGRELCCSTFLDHFEPISIRMAKAQGITLSPDKISGMCGRLMCCLVYEQTLYRRLSTGLPNKGQDIDTEFGPASIQSVDVVNRRVTASFPSDGSTRTLPIEEINLVDDVTTTGPDSGPDLPAESLWEGSPPRKKKRHTSDEP